MIEYIVLTIVLLIINDILLLFFLKKTVKALVPAGLLRLASTGAKMMRQGRTVKERTAAMKQLQKQARSKVSKGLLDQIPFGTVIKGLGLTDNELIALMADKEFMQGISVILQVLGQIPNAIRGIRPGKGEKF